MLTKKEIEQMKKNAKVHKKVFEEIKKITKPGINIREINNLAGEIAKRNNVLCGFKGVYGFPDNICISINSEVVHGRASRNITLKEGDLVTYDFGIKDKGLKINTDAAISMIVGGDEFNKVGAKMIEANKKALYAGIKKAVIGNKIGDISSAIQKEIEGAGFFVVKDLTGHGVGKKLHEKPYIPNYGRAGSGTILKAGMTLAIEPILGQYTGKIVDRGNWELYIEDGSLGCQYEHTILITNNGPEIII